MNQALDRMFVIFKQMTGQTELDKTLCDNAEKHVRQLYDAGETDDQRLTVSGLTYLKRHHAEA